MDSHSWLTNPDGNTWSDDFDVDAVNDFWDDDQGDNPINAYDTTFSDRHDDLLWQIHRDLGSLGEVSINGEITPLRDTVMLDDVSLFIDSPHFRIPIDLDVSWSNIDKSFTYGNQRGGTYEPRSGDYADSPHLTRMTEKVMTRLVERGANVFAKNVEATGKSVNKYQKKSLKTRLFNAVGQPASAITGAGMIVTGPDDLWFYAYATVFAAAVGAHVAVSRHMEEKSSEAVSAKSHAEAVEEWNKDPKQNFYDLFDDINERAVFMEHLLKVCSRSNIAFDGSVKVTPRYDTGHRLGRVLKTPLIQFTGHRVWKYLKEQGDKETYLFDGKHLYLVPDRGSLDDKICPL